MIIRTKIVATVGPVSEDAGTLAALAAAGCDVFRINFSHGTEDEHQRQLENIRAVEERHGEPLAVMADLCGPKIRVGPVEGGSAVLVEGESIVIQRDPITGRSDRISTSLPELVDDVEPGQSILLDDGKIRLVVTDVSRAKEFTCRIARGGRVSSGKGVNLPDTDLRTPALTEKDRRDVDWIAERDFDFVALSFVRSADDIRRLRELLTGRGCGANIVAKIEKPQAVENIEQIVDAADGVMVARGDLGVEMNLPEVPVAQKRIARLCQSAGKPCIIATQMLETMTHSPIPTRAEVSDVANAVLDHTDAVMLSGETAIGEYPVESARMMNEIVSQVESFHDETSATMRIAYAPAPTTAALAGAVREILRTEDVAAVAVFSASGTTARMLSKNRLPRPILAISQHLAAVRRMCLYYGVTSVRADAPEHTRDVLALAERFMTERELASAGDRIVVLSGRPIGEPGATNTLVVHTME